MILDFQCNTTTTVEQTEPGSWKIVASADDNFFGVRITLEVKFPALDIRSADIQVTRDVMGTTPDMSEATKKLIGVRVGPGMTKIVRSLLGGEGGSERISELMLETMEMLINGLTVAEMKKAMQTGGQPVSLETDVPRVPLNDVLIGMEKIKEMAANPRLKNSCAAFKEN